ncbi:MAG: COG4315 family predicted lipoprotein [Streptosporangiaceae bacterium]
MHIKVAAAAGLTTLGVLAAACGGTGQAGGSSAGSSNSSANGGGKSMTGAAVVETHSGPAGTYLTDGSGKTLYLFVPDKNGKSTCYGSCATFWPPLKAGGHPKAQAGAKSGMVGTTTRKNGTKQVTYGGHPLYYYVKDKAPGDTTGQGVDASGGLWWLVSPSGSAITKSSSGAKGGSSSGSGGSYGGGGSGGGGGWG